MITKRSFDQRSAAERAADERYENFLIHFQDDKKRKRYRPRWDDDEAVVRLFDDEEFIEWTADFPELPGNPIEEALRSGDHAELARLVRRRREGKRGPASKAKRAWKNPIHKAAFMVAEAEWILRYIYPEPSTRDIRDRAFLVVERMTGVSASKIAKYLLRPRKDRRRLV